MNPKGRPALRRSSLPVKAISRDYAAVPFESLTKARSLSRASAFALIACAARLASRAQHLTRPKRARCSSDGTPARKAWMMDPLEAHRYE